MNEPHHPSAPAGPANRSGHDATVAVVITSFNHAHFLGDAILSVLTQTRAADEIIVIDDGSTDDPAVVVSRFDGIRLIRQENLGLASARNTGLMSSSTSHIVFLDADDRLLATALESGLACARQNPESCFVYGGYRVISQDGRPFGLDQFQHLDDDAHVSFLQGNPIGMHAAVLYVRDLLLKENGFDESLRYCEDYDLYLRLARKYPVSSHQDLVAEYRWHGQNMSADLRAMLKAVLKVLDRHRIRIGSDPTLVAILEEGQAKWRHYYATELLETLRYKSILRCVREMVQAARWSPRAAANFTFRVVGRCVKRLLPVRI